MKILIITSDALRHTYFTKSIQSFFPKADVLVEPKKNYYNYQKQASKFVRDHFNRFKKHEDASFAEAKGYENKSLIVDNINNPTIVDKYKSYDYVCLFGSSILSSAWLQNYDCRIINLHLGLSPYYRGSATLFWPFYFDELQFLGTTIHIATSKVDAGGIVKRLQFPIPYSANYYQITNNLIKSSIDHYPHILKQLLSVDITPYAQESYIPSRLMKKADFSENVLKKVLTKYSTPLKSSDISRIYQLSPCTY